MCSIPVVKGLRDRKRSKKEINVCKNYLSQPELFFDWPLMRHHFVFHHRVKMMLMLKIVFFLSKQSIKTAVVRIWLKFVWVVILEKMQIFHIFDFNQTHKQINKIRENFICEIYLQPIRRLPQNLDRRCLECNHKLHLSGSNPHQLRLFFLNLIFNYLKKF